MPSTTVLLLNVLLGSIGAGYMVYGRRNNHLLATICGLLLLVVPSLISAPLPLVLAGMAVMTLPFLMRS
jgi:predicted cobalt transporter CbtA